MQPHKLETVVILMLALACKAYDCCHISERRGVALAAQTCMKGKTLQTDTFRKFGSTSTTFLSGQNIDLDQAETDLK